MRMRLITVLAVLLVAALAYVAWRQNTAPAETPAEAQGGMGDDGSGGMVAAPQDPGLAWKTPARWTEEPASGMRLATYVVPAQSGGGEGARCKVYYFGPGQGGGVEANIERWIGEFENPGKPERRDFTVAGIKVARVGVTGTYLAHAGGDDGAAQGAAGWTLLGAIVEGPEGAVFFKLAGPTGTVTPAAKEFDALLASVRKK